MGEADGESKAKIDAARAFALKAHGNQRYGLHPYRRHLEDVVDTLGRFLCVEAELFCAAWLHDCLEDTDATEEELSRLFGARVGALVAAVTLAPGVERSEALRAAYQKIRLCPGATMLKLADRIANVDAALAGPLEKLEKYRREHPGFKAALQKDGEYVDLWSYLDFLIALKEAPQRWRRDPECAVCGQTAATVTLLSAQSPFTIRFGNDCWTVSRSRFLSATTSFLRKPGDGEKVREALEREDYRALQRVDRDIGAFFCWGCKACYCADHWTRLPQFDEDGYGFDHMDGLCPKGHQKTIDR